MNRIRLNAILAGIAVLAAACGSSTTTTSSTPPIETTVPGTETTGGTTTGLPTIDPFDVAGDIVTAGSSTVFPLTEAVVAQFEDEGYGGVITIDSVGTGAGFERFCVTGETDIANASRAIKDDELAACEAIGRDPIEFRVGTDALTVVVSPDNYFVEDLTAEQLALAFSTAKTWADVDPSFPAHPIARFSPGTDSGTFDYFVEHVFEKEAEPLLAASNLQLSEDDNVLVQGVEGDSCSEGNLASPCAIGYLGFAYYTENEGKLTTVGIDGVVPSADTVDDGTYPLSRPLFIYSDASIMAAKPQVAGFIAYYLSVVNGVIDGVGYFPAPAAAFQASVDTYLSAVS